MSEIETAERVAELSAVSDTCIRFMRDIQIHVESQDRSHGEILDILKDLSSFARVIELVELEAKRITTR